MLKRITLTAFCLTVVVLVSSCTATASSKSGLADSQYEDVRVRLVDQARWAMSAHNMQPWEVVLDPEDSLALRVFLASSRLVPGADPYSRQLMMSIGGFIAVLEDAAAQEGYALQIDLFPEGGLSENDGGKSFRLPVAEVRLRSSEGAAGFPSLDAISSATVKANLGRATLSDTQMSSFLELDDSEEIHVRFVQDEAELSDLKPILKEAFRLEMEYEPTLLESYNLTRRNRRQARKEPFGISYAGQFPLRGLRIVELAETFFPMNPQKWGVRGADSFDEVIDDAGAFVVITTDGNTRRHQIEAGMLFERLWLRARDEGLAVVPASQPLQEYEAMAGHYAEIHERFALPGQTIQMVALFGLPDEGYRRGFRIAASDLMRD